MPGRSISSGTASPWAMIKTSNGATGIPWRFAQPNSTCRRNIGCRANRNSLFPADWSTRIVMMDQLPPQA